MNQNDVSLDIPNQNSYNSVTYDFHDTQWHLSARDNKGGGGP